GAASFVVADDFNGDGFPDLAVSSFSGQEITVFLNLADWGSAPGGAAPPPLTASELAGRVDSALQPPAFTEPHDKPATSSTANPEVRQEPAREDSQPYPRRAAPPARFAPLAGAIP